MKLWLFHFSVIHRDQILAEIDETLRKAGIEEKQTTTGVQILADRFRRADAYARKADAYVQGADRRVYELQQAVNEYERVFTAMKAHTEQNPLPPADEQPTLIELAARRETGIDLPLTAQTPVYEPPDTGPREMPVVARTRREKTYKAKEGETP